MNYSDIPGIRLRNQRITSAPLARPGEVVAWLGAVQSQDYTGAKWGLGLRMRSTSDADLEQAFTDGAIIRTHLMRPTWHFVARKDIRWMLSLTAPRVHAVNASMYRKLELDAALLKRSNAVFVKTLRTGDALTREELHTALERAGIDAADGHRLAYIVMHAELDGVLCSGPRRGRAFTYMLLDERAPDARTLDRDEALAELVWRYFRSHGPAVVHDFVWWSGLTVADARRGLAMNAGRLVAESIGDRTYYVPTETPAGRRTPARAHLLSNYDEYGSYRKYDEVFDTANAGKLSFSHNIAIDGRLAGTWKRTITKRELLVEISAFAPLNADERNAVAVAAERYGTFLGLPAVVA